MFVKNFLTAGSFLCLSPVGVRLTLQYDVRGLIQKIHQGWGDDRLDITDRIMPILLAKKIIPNKINIKTGTTWVSGVLYTPKKFSNLGKLPECVYEPILASLDDDKSKFNFFAGSVEAMSTVFRGAAAIRQWLNLNQFNTLPGFVIPVGFTEDQFQSQLNSIYPFLSPVVSDYIVIDTHGTTYHSLGLSQSKVKSITTCLDDDGYILADISFDTDSSVSSYTTDYSKLLEYDIRNSSIVIFDSDSNILYSYLSDKRKHKAAESVVVCSSCGKLITIHDKGKSRCGDTHCNSRLFNPTNRFLSKLGLPTITKDQYDTVVKSIGRIYTVPDILDTDMFSDVNIQCSLSRLLQSIVPGTVLRGTENFDLLCNRCNNSVNTLDYYIHNPDKLQHDLNLQDYRQFNLLVAWLKDPENVADIYGLLYNKHIHLVSTERKFDGAPIFRGKTLYLTGRFSHGSISEVSSILRSYSAEILNTFDVELTDGVIVGDLGEDIDGVSIRQAKDSNISVMSESEFFAYYDIDTDLHQNLE